MKTAFPDLRSIGLALALLCLGAVHSTQALAEDKFLSAIDDLPLMAQLDEIAGGVMVFDSPSGRIVESLTMGKVLKEDVEQFYSDTLPQLGWEKRAPGKYSREDEVLKLEFPQTTARDGTGSSGDPATISVLFMLSPAK